MHLTAIRPDVALKPARADAQALIQMGSRRKNMMIAKSTHRL